MRKLHIAIPALNEDKTLPKTLDALARQNCNNFDVYICVNQPEDWWNDSAKYDCCESNIRTLEYLSTFDEFPITIIDRASKGQGWQGKRGGVGWARKTIMDEICRSSADDDIIVSLDADTLVKVDYVSALLSAFDNYAKIDTAISIPYFHQLTDDEEINRAILRYEIYLRYYAINLWRIGSPYSFTALGSAMAFTVFAYKKCGGMPPRASGEDFYMLQKLQKTCSLFHWCRTEVYPSARISERVIFGTGAAVAKGIKNDWVAYPIYSYKRFDDIKKTIECFSQLFKRELETPLSGFLREQLKSKDLWETLRKNHSTEERFIRACHERLDGLSTFQYLRAEKNDGVHNSWGNLIECLRKYYADYVDKSSCAVKTIVNGGVGENIDFLTAEIKQLDEIRRLLMIIENDYRRCGLGLQATF